MTTDRSREPMHPAGATKANLPWGCDLSLTAEAYSRLTRRAILEYCKWHTQADDQPVLCPFPLVIRRDAWARVSALARTLALETMATENELRQRVDLHERLGLPAAIRKALRNVRTAKTSDRSVRVIRFDFHWTTDGWRISEANTDVAGGWIEASAVSRLMAAEYPQLETLGDPTALLVHGFRSRLGLDAMIGFLHLTIYSEDRQVMLYLANAMKSAGLATCLFGPEQLRWNGDQPVVESAWYSGPLDGLFRFFPAEWLPSMPFRSKWMKLFQDGDTVTCNPPYAVLTQSKRFPLTWNALSTPLLTWQALLPQTVAPFRAGADASNWVIKPALGHEGKDIAISGVRAPDEWSTIESAALRKPASWVMQRRFEPVATATPEGPMYPCLGVYVIGGQIAGAYGRISRRPLIDDRSREVIVLARKTE